jgi:TIGR03009 family protein
MLRPRWTVTTLLLFAPALAAQQPAAPVRPTGQQPPAPPPVALDPAKNRLDALLLQWEARMKGVQGLVAECVRTETDDVDKTQVVFQGTAKFLRPNRALLYMQKKSNPDIYERYICTGTFLYEYRPQNKLVRIHQLPAPPPGGQQVVEDNFLAFLFGMKAEEAKRRYTITLMGEDQNYVYLQIIPNYAADKADFSKARLALFNTTFLPREVSFQQPNGTIVKWDVPRIDTSAPLSPGDFNPVPVAKDWKQEVVRPADVPGAAPGALPPSKVRPSGGN